MAGLELDLEFPKAFSSDTFLFGVANCPYLCEGGYNTPDGPKNSFGVLEASGAWEPSGDATRFWSDPDAHIELAQSLGLNAFRMGIEWARVQPSASLTPHPESPPEWDSDALDHYADIVASVIAHGMQPTVTLQHFTHPAWLGGHDLWLSDEGPDRLVDYQLRVVEEINDRLVARGSEVLRYLIVYNEASNLPQLYHLYQWFQEDQGLEHLLPCYDRILSRYIRIYDGLHDLFVARGWGTPDVGFSVNLMGTYEYDRLMYDVVRLREAGVPREGAATALAESRAAYRSRIDALAKSKLTDPQYAAYDGIAAMTPDLFPVGEMRQTLDALYASPRVQKLDYLSTSIYDPFIFAKMALVGDAGVDGSNGGGWDTMTIDPEIFGTFIDAMADGAVTTPFYLGENSCANSQPIGGQASQRLDGWTRERYLKEHLMVVVRAVKSGIPIRGYFYWSLVDDYEWIGGYSSRLGLYNYDYLEGRILETDGLGEPSGEIYAHLSATLRGGNKDDIREAFTNAYRRPAGGLTD
jgi:beta-glucosidase